MFRSSINEFEPVDCCSHPLFGHLIQNVTPAAPRTSSQADSLFSRLSSLQGRSLLQWCVVVYNVVHSAVVGASTALCPCACRMTRAHSTTGTFTSLSDGLYNNLLRRLHNTVLLYNTVWFLPKLSYVLIKHALKFLDVF